MGLTRVHAATVLALAAVQLLPVTGCTTGADIDDDDELEAAPPEAIAVVERLAEGDDASIASLNPEFFDGDTARRRPRVRKNIRNLTNNERKDYVDAVLKLKKTKSPYDDSLSYYDQFVAWHVTLNLCEFGQPLPMQMGHGSPIFLPWHRVFTLLFETALRQVSGKSITVPYWEWVTTPDHDKAVVFADDFMGGAGDPMDNYAVKTGPFRKGKWKLKVDPPGTRWAPYATNYLTRYLGMTPFPLPTQADVDLMMSTTVYDIPPYDHTSTFGASFRNTLEGNRGDGPPLTMECTEDGTMPIPIGGSALHNGIHAWVGGPFTNGTMVLPTSPSDPVFFLHHSQVDRLWANWQEQHGVDTYEPQSGDPHIDENAVMMPFDHYGINVTPAKVADIKKLGYRYQ
jgi:tyrosinase